MTFQDFAKTNPLFRAESLGEGITRITDVMDVNMYLIEGADRAVLLDTGLGIGELFPVVAAVTKLPVEVYLTHGHVDHGGGMYGFDSVYVTPEDRELLAWQTKPELRRDFAAAYNPELHEIEDLSEHIPYREMDIQLCRVGDVIDLGGRTLTIIDLCGHTRGSVGFFDSRTSTLFAGDGCNNSTFLFLRESSTVAEYRETLRRLKDEWLPKVKRILICHGPHLSVPLSLIDDLIECCSRVLRGDATKSQFLLPYKPFRNGVARWAAEGEDHRWDHDGKYGNLIYSETPCGVDVDTVEILLDGEPFTETSGELLADLQSQDRSAGIQTRDVEWRSLSGKELVMRFERMVYQKQLNGAALRISIMSRQDAAISFHSGIAKATMEMDLHQTAESHAFSHDGQYLQYVQGDLPSGNLLLFSACHGVTLDGKTIPQVQDIQMTAQGIRSEYSVEVRAGQTLVLEKLVNLYAPKSQESKGKTLPELRAFALSELKQDEELGFAALAEETAQYRA